MLITGMITFGFGSACCIGVAALAYAQFKSVHIMNWKTAAARAFAYSYAIVSTLFGAYWCWLIFATCWQLITDPDGPGALGSLIFPFWAAIAATPPLIESRGHSICASASKVLLCLRPSPAYRMLDCQGRAWGRRGAAGRAAPC